jgi:hypothetical protein
MRWCLPCLGPLLLALAALGASAASPKRVLILDPFGRDVAPFSAVVSSFRATLEREVGERVDIYEVPLDLARLAEAEGEGPLVAFLEGQIKTHPVDLVVPIGGAGSAICRTAPPTPLSGHAGPGRCSCLANGSIRHAADQHHPGDPEG